MHFAVQKDVLVKALKDVTSAIATRVVQPILSNVLIESQDTTALRFQGTDLDLAIETRTPAVVYESGSITLPGKKLLEIVSKLPNELVVFKINKENYETTVSCQRSKFTITGLPAEDFPKLTDSRSVEGFLMPADVLKKSISQTCFAAATYDSNTILGGVYLLIENGSFECTATDGSRLAHRRETLSVSVPQARKVEVEGDKQTESKSNVATMDRPVALKAIIPARACQEVIKLLDVKDEVRIVITNGQVVFETETHYLSSRLISGEYPRYNELFPKEFSYLASFKREEFLSGVDRVAVMSDDRTHLVKMHFERDTMQLSANTPDVGGAQEEVPMHFEGNVLDVAVNVRYVVEVLQRLGADEIQLEMSGPLKPLVVKPIGDEAYKYLLMPVQAK